MEGSAESMRCQGKFQDALELEQEAAEDRLTHGLPQNAAVPELLELNAPES